MIIESNAFLMSRKIATVIKEFKQEMENLRKLRQHEQQSAMHVRYESWYNFLAVPKMTRFGVCLEAVNHSR